MAETATMHAACGACGGPIVMVTCNMATGSGHDWVLCSVCPACRGVHWTQTGCTECDGSAALPPERNPNG